MILTPLIDSLDRAGWDAIKRAVKGESYQVQAFLADTTIIPYVRMTQRSKFANPKAKAYREQQRALAWMIHAVKSGSVARYPASLSLIVSFKDGRKINGDQDNVQKAVLDALVKAKVIEDDSLKYVVGTDFVRVQKGSEDFVWIGLR